MWEPRKYNSAMESPLPAQPWTPPDMEIEASPRSDYFSDPFRPSPAYPSHAHADNPWARSTSRPDTPSRRHQRWDTQADLYDHSRPKIVERLSDPAPHTPKRIINFDNDGALRYPYTPDSSRILRRSTELPSSPPPWDEYSEQALSPVQDALSSCLAHFENLLQSQQPDEDQMEYIVGQFEAMTSYLSAPDSQTRRTEEHLFSEVDVTPGTGLGITDEDDGHAADTDYISKEAHEAYVAHVGSYIEGVKKYIEDLKMRLDEVKTLNNIQLDVIEDLRRQMKTVHQGMRSSLDMGDDVKLVEDDHAMPAGPRGRRVSFVPEKEFGLDSWETLVDGDRAAERLDLDDKPDAGATQNSKDASALHYSKPERRSFWASIGHALDSFGDMLREE